MTHVHLLAQVEGLPGYVLEPDSHGVREVERKSGQVGSQRDNPEGAARSGESEVSQRLLKANLPHNWLRSHGMLFEGLQPCLQMFGRCAASCLVISHDL